MPRCSRPVFTALAVSLSCALTGAVTMAAAPPALAWSNGGAGSGPAGQGDGYGTHDWILSQAMRTAGAKGKWLNLPLALNHTDDPDYARVDNTHVFFEKGDGRGAAQVVSDLYAMAVEAYHKGDISSASRDVGLMAHYIGDMSQPYHTAYAAVGLPSTNHNLIESLVEHELQASTPAAGAARRHDWTTPRAPKMLGSIRNAVVREAAYSRQFFPLLNAEMNKHPTTISGTVNSIVDKVLTDDANQVGDVIATIPTGRGLAIDVKTLTTSVSKAYGGRGQYETVFGHGVGTDGRPIEGLAIDFSYPTASGKTSTFRKYTDSAGNASFSVVIGDLAYDRSYATLAHVVTSPHTVHTATKDARSSFIITRQLLTGTDGFSSHVADTTPAVGSKLSISSTTTNTDGNPQGGLKVTYTWPFPSGTVTTVAYSDTSGHTSSSVTVPSSARGHSVQAAAETQAGGFFRHSSSTFTAH